MNFRTKLLVSLIPVTVAGLILQAAVTVMVSSKAIMASVEENMTSMVDKTLRELGGWLDDRERETVLLSELDVIRDACQGVEEKKAIDYMGKYFSQSSIYENVFIADIQGTIIHDGIGGKSIGVEIAKIPVYKKKALD